MSVQLSKAVLAKFLTLFKDTFHNWQGSDEVIGESRHCKTLDAT